MLLYGPCFSIFPLYTYNLTTLAQLGRTKNCSNRPSQRPSMYSSFDESICREKSASYWDIIFKVGTFRPFWHLISMFYPKCKHPVGPHNCLTDLLATNSHIEHASTVKMFGWATIDQWSKFVRYNAASALLFYPLQFTGIWLSVQSVKSNGFDSDLACIGVPHWLYTTTNAYY